MAYINEEGKCVDDGCCKDLVEKMQLVGCGESYQDRIARLEQALAAKVRMEGCAEGIRRTWQCDTVVEREALQKFL